MAREPKSDISDLSSLPTETLVDRYGEADRQFKLFIPQINPHAATRAAILKELAGRYPDLAAESQQLCRGKAYQLEITPREIQRPITIEVKQLAWKRLKHLKADPFAAFSITLAELRSQLGKKFVKDNVAEVRTGPRNYNVTALQEAVSTQPSAAGKSRAA
jgi:hypothetical protein